MKYKSCNECLYFKYYGTGCEPFCTYLHVFLGYYYENDKKIYRKNYNCIF
jgi:hypothetical protein